MMIAVVANTVMPTVVGKSKPQAVDERVAEARQTEDRLREDRSAEPERDVHTQHRDDGKHRVPQDVRAHHNPFRRAFGASCAHIVLVHRVENVRANHPHVERCKENRIRRPGEEHVVGPLHRSTATCPERRVDHVAIPCNRRQAKLVAEEIRKNEPDEHGVGRDADEDEHHCRPVHQRAWPQRGENADGNCDQHPEEDPAEDERRGHGGGVADDRVDILAVCERGAERGVEDQLLEELPVLDVERTVKPQIVCNPRDILGARRLAGEQPRRGRQE